MTDPVDTDALRDMKNTENLWPENAALVDAAANEVDRLRDRAMDDARDRERLRIDFNARSAEASRLRAVIENAPHAPRCVHYAATWQTIGEPCTCWKADAL